MDSKESWDRLDDDVRKQLKWMENPMRITDSQFKEISEELKPDSKLHRWAEDEYDFQEKFHNEDLNLKIDLNDKMIQYIDLKSNHIWSDDYMKKIKG